jgi:DNA-binding CsgD family transcriptional regulator/PAS domain-containing protein
MDEEEGLLDLVGRMYDAALQPETWPDVLTRAADGLEAKSASLILQESAAAEPSGPGVTQAHVARLDPDTLAEYQRTWVPLDLGLQAMQLMAPGAIATDESVANSREWRRSAIYNDFLLPRQIARVLAGLPLKDGQGMAHVFFHRPASDGPYEARERRLLRRLMPHLTRTLMIRRHLLDLNTQRQAVAAALDRLPVGILLLAADARVLHLNHAAEAIVAEADGLTIGKSGLSAVLAAETRALQRCVREAVATGEGRGVGCGGSLRVSRPSLRGPLSVVVSPLRMPSALESRGGAVAVAFVTDPARTRTLPEGMMRALYGLTPAEDRVARRLARGESLAEVARHLEVALETVRTHLKRALQKTDTRRQAELVALMARLVSEPVDRR